MDTELALDDLGFLRVTALQKRDCRLDRSIECPLVILRIATTE